MLAVWTASAPSAVEPFRTATRPPVAWLIRVTTMPAAGVVTTGEAAVALGAAGEVAVVDPMGGVELAGSIDACRPEDSVAAAMELIVPGAVVCGGSGRSTEDGLTWRTRRFARFVAQVGVGLFATPPEPRTVAPPLAPSDAPAQPNAPARTGIRG